MCNLPNAIHTHTYTHTKHKHVHVHIHCRSTSLSLVECICMRASATRFVYVCVNAYYQTYRPWNWSNEQICCTQHTHTHTHAAIHIHVHLYSYCKLGIFGWMVWYLPLTPIEIHITDADDDAMISIAFDVNKWWMSIVHNWTAKCEHSCDPFEFHDPFLNYNWLATKRDE